jgi:hypothetical protein
MSLRPSCVAPPDQSRGQLPTSFSYVGSSRVFCLCSDWVLLRRNLAPLRLLLRRDRSGNQDQEPVPFAESFHLFIRG